MQYLTYQRCFDRNMAAKEYQRRAIKILDKSRVTHVRQALCNPTQGSKANVKSVWLQNICTIRFR